MIVPQQPAPAFGFLTVVEEPALGFLGGYLIVNHRGRPIEFHCTAPVQPTRAEEILYGPTLRPHLFCERIGGALLAKAEIQPKLLIVNQLEAWQLADEASLPVVMVDRASSRVESIGTIGEERAAQACLDQIPPERRNEVQQQLHELVRYVDLTEPFERIVDAIREAMGAGDSVTGEAANDQAA